MTHFSSFLKENNPGGSSDSDRAGEIGTDLTLNQLFSREEIP